MRLTLKRTNALILTALIIISFAALIQRQRDTFGTAKRDNSLPGSLQLAVPVDPNRLLLLPVYFNSISQTAENSFPVLNNGTRTEIYNTIVAYPGIHFRGICDTLGLSIGLAEYHLGVLKKAGLISFIRDGRYKRYFKLGEFSRKEMLAISLMRHKTVKEIFMMLLDKKRVSHGEMASHLCVTSQALTWQMQCLKETDFILQVNEGVKTFYSLPNTSAQMLSKCIVVVNSSQVRA